MSDFPRIFSWFSGMVGDAEAGVECLATATIAN